LERAALGRLLTSLRLAFSWDAVEEATFECAPQSVSRTTMLALRHTGFNRISLGVQELDDRVLMLNGRVHQVADVKHAYDTIRAVGFDEVNVDLMAGLLGQTDESFQASLASLIAMAPDSVTIYQMEVPRNTPLCRSLASGTSVLAPASWEIKRARLAWAFTRLEEAGYSVRSAYAAARNQTHRRFVYQEEQYRGADLLGLGVSSFSYLAGIHYQNHASLERYTEALAGGQLPVSRAYVLNDRERLVREFVLQLKLGRVDAEPFRRRFGVDVSAQFAAPLEELASAGWLTYDASGVTLTRDGLLRIDRLLPAFYLPRHRALPYW